MSRPISTGPSMPWPVRYSTIACVIAAMCASLNDAVSEQPRWPEVPKTTRWAGTAGSGTVSA